jgi:general stress protein 26
MKQARGVIQSAWPAGLLGILVVLSGPVTGQAPAGPPDRARVIGAAREVMAKARYCSMVTLGADGELQARVVDPFAPDAALTIWIGTNAVTRKVAEVRKDPRATLICLDAGDQAYVTWIGRADVVTDAAEKARHWKAEWAGFYKDANRGDDYVLIRFRPRRIELISPAHQLMNDPATWRPVTVILEQE